MFGAMLEYSMGKKKNKLTFKELYKKNPKFEKMLKRAIKLSKNNKGLEFDY